MSYDEKDSYDEEDLIRAFTRISNTRRASAVTLGDTCRQIWRQDTWYYHIKISLFTVSTVKLISYLIFQSECQQWLRWFRSKTPNRIQSSCAWKCGNRYLASYINTIYLILLWLGKTSIISQLLYDAFPEDHTPTIEDMYRSLS